MIQLSNVFKSKLRLYIEYALILIIVVLAGAVLYGYVSKGRLETQVATLGGKLTAAETRVQAVEDINKQQADAIETINNLTGVSDTMLKGLAADMEALRVRDRTAFGRLAALEKSNEAVRKYLNTAVPAPVGCVLDHSCPDQDADRVPATKPRAAPKVPAAPASAKPNQR